MKITDLRQHAEETLGKQQSAEIPTTGEDTLRLVHELQVHQIELEMQNEELVQARAEAEAVHRQYTGLFDFAPVGYFTLDRDGAISQVNLTGATLLGAEAERGKLLNNRFGLFVSPKSLPIFAALLEKAFVADGEKQTCEVELLKSKTESFWAQIEAASDEAHETCRAVVVDITERKRADEALAHLNSALMELNRFSIDLSMLPLEEDLEGLIARQIKELSGAEVAIFSEYNPANRTTTPQHIEMNPGLLDKVVHLLGTQVKNIHSVVSDEMYREMTTELIGVRRTLSEAAFGAIPPQVGKAIQALLRVDRFIGIAYLIEGKLYGTTLLGMSKDQPDPPRIILENYVFLAASALRRKQAEEALNNKQRLLTETEKMGKVGAWEFDIVTQKQTWTEEVYRIHEVDSTDNPTVDQGLNFYTPASRPIIERAVQRAIEQAEPFDVELEIMTAKGNLRMVHAIGKADLEHHRVFGFFQDITERKQAEKTLRLHTERLQAMLKLNQMIDVTHQQLTHYALEEAVRITQSEIGYLAFLNDDETVLTMHSWSKQAMKECAIIDKPIQYVVTETGLWGEAVRQRRPVITNDYAAPNPAKKGHPQGHVPVRRHMNVPVFVGQHIVLVAGVGNKEGEYDNSDADQLTLLMEGMWRLIERKKAEEALRLASLYVRNLIETNLDPLVTISPEGKITDINRATESVTGVPREELIGSDFAGFFTEPEEARAGYQQVFAEGLVRDYPLTIRSTSGATTDVMYNATVYKDEAGEIQGVFATARDITERKRAEEALRVNEAKLRALTEQVQVGIVVHAPDTSILFSNPMASEVLGLTPDQMRGKKAIDPAWCFIREDGTNVPLADYPVNQAMAKEMPISGLVLGVIRPDRQSPIWVECNASKIRDPAGELEQVVITFSDITARKLAEEALRQSNERLLLATTAGGVGIWELDVFNNKLTWDAQMFRLYGITSDDFGGAYETWKAGVHPEDVARADAEVQMALRGERGFDTEFRVVWPSGTIRHIAARAQVHRNAVGQPAKLIGTNYDVTELKQAQEAIRKLNAELEQRVVERTAQLQTAYNQLEDSLAKRQRAQEALRESEARFRRLSEAAFEAINIHDGGVLLDANEKYYTMFGFKPKELLGKQVMSLTIAPEAIEAVKKEIATGGVGPYESTGLRKDGTRFPMEIRVRGLEYEGRKVRVAAIMDITERKRAGEDLQQRTAQLEAANKELEAFSYSVSHDLRAPLRGIDGWSLALLEDYGSQLDGQAKTYLERVRSETQRMGQLIDDLLQLSRLTSAEMSIGKVDLSALAGRIAGSLQKAQPDRRVEFVIQPRLNAHGDARLLEIALTNLLDNAFKFTGKTPQARIEFGQTEVEGQRAFFVRDNGAGFDMALAKKLFGAFQRMHKASEFPGTGVGLTTVQRIVHRHGGRIWAEAAVDQGATFYFTLEEIP